VNGRPPELSPYRLLAGLVLPLVAYVLVRAAVGSATGALAITEAVPATWLLVVWITRRRASAVVHDVHVRQPCKGQTVHRPPSKHRRGRPRPGLLTVAALRSRTNR
jgi:hypothetical protein